MEHDNEIVIFLNIFRKHAKSVPRKKRRRIAKPRIIISIFTASKKDVTYLIRCDMTQQQALQLFEEKRVRTVWDDEQEKWYFSIVDVVAVLTGSDRPRKYWSDLKKKLQQEGSEVSEKIGHFKMKAEDGKNRITDVADTEQLFRIIQSIPSPKAEPFKQWMALTWPRFASLRGTKQSRGVGFLDCRASLAMTVTMTVAVIARHEAIQKRA